MRALHRLALAALWVALASPLAAQPNTAYLTPRGAVGVQVGGVQTFFDSRYGSAAGGAGSSERAALGSDFEAALARRVQPLLPSLESLGSDLSRLLAATEDTAAPTPGLLPTPENLTLGSTRVRLASERTALPITVTLGVLPRLNLGVTMPFYRGTRTEVQSLGLAGATVGLNPDTAANRAAFARLGPEFAVLGSGALLPTLNSQLGREILARLRARRTGGNGGTLADSVRLPQRAFGADLTELVDSTAFGPDSLAAGAPVWWAGDVQLFGRLQLLNTLGRDPYPTGRGRLHLRSALGLGLRLPTGDAGSAVSVFALPREVGHGGYSARSDTDLFIGDRFWTSFAAEYRSVRSAQVQRWVVRAADPFDTAGAAVRTVERDPGDELWMEVAPRLRFTRAWGVGARLGVLRTEEEVYRETGDDPLIPASELDLPRRTARYAGAELRYSTLSAAAAGRRVLPVEVELRYLTAVSGSGGAPAAQVVEFAVTAYQQLWNRRPPR